MELQVIIALFFLPVKDMKFDNKNIPNYEF